MKKAQLLLAFAIITTLVLVSTISVSAYGYYYGEIGENYVNDFSYKKTVYQSGGYNSQHYERYEATNSRKCDFYGCETKSSVYKKVQTSSTPVYYRPSSYTHVSYTKTSASVPSTSWRYDMPPAYEYGRLNYYAPRYDSDLGYYNWRY